MRFSPAHKKNRTIYIRIEPWNNLQFNEDFPHHNLWLNPNEGHLYGNEMRMYVWREVAINLRVFNL